jgi:Protein of unknown function (DUF2380)
MSSIDQTAEPARKIAAKQESLTEGKIAKEMVFVKSVDIRGNTNEPWQRGLDYLLQHYLFIK